jgi:hypothetical protein
MKVGKINNLKNINIQDMGKFSNSVSSHDQFGKYLFNMTPPIQVFINIYKPRNLKFVTSVETLPAYSIVN